jgi:hypothetical protein
MIQIIQQKARKNTQQTAAKQAENADILVE